MRSEKSRIRLVGVFEIFLFKDMRTKRFVNRIEVVKQITKRYRDKFKFGSNDLSFSQINYYFCYIP